MGVQGVDGGIVILILVGLNSWSVIFFDKLDFVSFLYAIFHYCFTVDGEHWWGSLLLRCDHHHIKIFLHEIILEFLVIPVLILRLEFLNFFLKNVFVRLKRAEVTVIIKTGKFSGCEKFNKYTPLDCLQSIAAMCLPLEGECKEFAVRNGLVILAWSSGLRAPRAR